MEILMTITAIYTIVIWVLICYAIGVWAIRWDRSGIGYGALAIFASPLLASLVLFIYGRK